MKPANVMKLLRRVKASRDIPKPLYLQIADEITTMIQAGVLKHGAKLPPSRELAKLWNVSLMTVHAGIQELARRGKVHRRPHVGTMVCSEFNQPQTHKIQRPVAMILSHVHPEDPYWLQVMREFSMELQKNGCCALLSEYPSPEGMMSMDWLRLNVSGVVLCGYNDARFATELAQNGIPTVALGDFLGEQIPPEVPVDLFLHDEATRGYQGVATLAALGHREIGVCCGPAGSILEKRLRQGIEQAIAEYSQCSIRWYLADSLTTEAGEKAATEFLCCASPVSAIFTAGGYPALGVMRTAQRLGLKIPDELSLIARTAYSISELAVPPLTICGLPQRSWIREAASLLIQRIRSSNETHSPRSHVVPIGGVMIRGTTRRVHNHSSNQETSQ